MANGRIHVLFKSILVFGYLSTVSFVIKRRIERFLNSKGTLLARVLSAYIIFALSHHLYKVMDIVMKYSRAVVAWRNLPGDFMSLDGKDITENWNRLHDWRLERRGEAYDAPLIKSAYNEVVANSPEAVEWVLRNEFLVCTKPGRNQDIGMELLGDFIGQNGIFCVRHGRSRELTKEHDMWLIQRKTASLIFTKSNFVNLMREAFQLKAESLLRKLDSAAEVQTKVDMQAQYFAFTMDSIQKIFFGKDVDTIRDNKPNEFGNAFDEAQRALFHEILSAIPVFVMNRVLLPFPFGDIAGNFNLSLVWQIRKHFFSKHRKNFWVQKRILDDFALKVISQAKSDPNLKNRRDLLANFLNSKDADKYSDSLLRDIILSMTIAGRDTTACTLTWMTYILTQNPDVQAKLCEEVDSKLKGRSPTLEDLEPKNMPYLNGVLFETLRLYPPVPEDSKIVAEDGVKYFDGTPLFKGTQMVFVPYSMGRNPKVYANPEKVDPSRWIPFKYPDHFAFPVFQAGPRLCLGKDMAQFEAKVGLFIHFHGSYNVSRKFLMAKLLQKFTFSLVEGEAEKITYSLMITMSLCNSKQMDSHNLWIIPHKRNHT